MNIKAFCRSCNKGITIVESLTELVKDKDGDYHSKTDIDTEDPKDLEKLT